MCRVDRQKISHLGASMDPLKALMSVMMASPSSPAELASSAPATPKADKRGRDDADGGSFVDKIKTPKSDPSTPIVGLSAWSINSPVRTSPAATSMVDDAIAHRSSVVVAAALFTTTSGYCHNCGIDGHWSRECPNVWAKMCARKMSVQFLRRRHRAERNSVQDRDWQQLEQVGVPAVRPRRACGHRCH